MKLWLRCEYPETDTYEQSCASIGKYQIKYNSLKGPIGQKSWKSPCVGFDSTVEFYEDGVMYHSEQFNRLAEIHPIIGGDGLSRETTYYIVCKNRKYCIYNMNHELVRETQLGGDIPVALVRVSPKYILAVGEEMCTYSRFLGLVDSDVLFDTKQHSEHTCPYDNSRIGLPAECYEDESFPIEATETGFVVGVSTSDWTEFVKYDDIYDYDFNNPDFEGEHIDPNLEALKILGFNIKDDVWKSVLDNASQQINTASGSVSISVDQLKELSKE
jgi:hypothetical protein